MYTIKECPVCANTELTQFLTCSDYSVSRESFSLKKCAQCNFVLTTPQPDKEILEQYYQSENYVSHTNKGNDLINKLYLIARTYTLKQKLKLINKYNSPGKILDVGCGTGNFLNVCKQYGWHIHGMEPSLNPRNIASMSLDSVYSSLTDIKDTNYDSITLWHVLEHIADLNETLEILYSKLSHDGTIFIAVPNYQSYDAQHYKQYWAAYDVPRHLWHFSQQAMHSLLQKNRFNLVTIKPMKLDSFYVSMLSEKYRNSNRLTFQGLINAFWIGLLSNKKAKNNNYSSLIYIAQK